MTTFQSIYKVDAPVVRLTAHAPSSWWFPEVSDFDIRDEDLLQRLDNQGRMQVKLVGHDNGDGYRYATLATIWYNGCPVMIVQEAGRGGRDHQRRWITDVLEYKALCIYLRSQITIDIDPHEDEVVSPDAFIFADELYNFYGATFGDPYSVKIDAQHTGFMVMRNGREGSPQYVANEDAEQYLVFIKASVAAAPEYVRRDSFVMKLVGELSKQDYESNMALQNICDSQGYEKCYWYSPVERPDNTPIVRI